MTYYIRLLKHLPTSLTRHHRRTTTLELVAGINHPASSATDPHRTDMHNESEPAPRSGP